MTKINLGLRKFLEITDIKASTRSEELREEMRERLAIPTGWITPPWSGPKDQQNKTDIFLSVYGVLYVIVRSKKICLSDIKHITSAEGLDTRKMVARNQIDRMVRNTDLVFKGQDHDVFLSVYGVFYVIVRSKKICLSKLDSSLNILSTLIFL